ncbi:MAG TPA: deoxyribodipyrimidine photo-lyase [Bryobacteraceae bacterium]|nr:deoxyribodipyrimidine photo-lyase [Bryobacteraceae bacterium]
MNLYCSWEPIYGIHASVAVVEPERITALNSKGIQQGADYVLYWTQMNRRVSHNHALAYAIELANSLELPTLYYEGLGCDYPHANDRIHTFVLEGVPDTARALEPLGIGYAFYLRKKQRDPNDILYRLAQRAAAVITDDYPTFVTHRHNASVPAKINTPYFVVDSSCIVPMNRFEKREWAAYTMRPKITKMLPEYLHRVRLPAVRKRWTEKRWTWQTNVTDEAILALVASCDIDHSVKPSTAFRGGSREANRRLRSFLNNNLRRYAKDRNDPAEHATSDLSPYLHFGHISSLEVALRAKEHAREHKLVPDEFLEELIVRRELAFNFARFTPNHDCLDSLPDWALRTLEKHAKDARDPQYTAKQMETAETYDELWNATQKELLVRGKIHGYYRMYWGKKIIEWARTHEEALTFMLYLHDKYALDGRDPNTYTNVLWCFGLHDRPWAERPIFGQIRYMSYEGMRRKTNVEAYIREIEELKRT